MEELHRAIAAYLRRNNRRLIAKSAPPVPLASARCRACGRPIMDAGAGRVPSGQGALGPLLAAQRCAECYLREAA